MKTIRFYDRGDIRIENIPGPAVVPNTVGINVAWYGICGIDLHGFMEGPILILPCGHLHSISDESVPVTMGHKFSGVVHAVNEDMDDIKVGQHVAVEPYIIRDDVSTGEDSNYRLSKDMNLIGLGGCGGDSSEKIAVRRRRVHPISDKIPLGQAVSIEPLSVGHHAYVRSGAEESGVALIGGTGPIDLLLTAVLKAKDIKVTITKLSKVRKDRTHEVGVADYILDPSEIDIVEEVRKLTSDEGADVTFECTNVSKVLGTMVETYRSTAKVVIVSAWSRPVIINVHNVVTKELDMCDTIAYCSDHAEAIKLVEEGKINLKLFITQRTKLGELVSEGFERLIRNNESAVKIIVNPNL